MGQVPTGTMERELRKLYLQWVAGLPAQVDNVAPYLDDFERRSRLLIARYGGQVASLGALAGFPVPKVLELSPRAGVIYDDMKQAAVKAGITAGLNSREAARALFNAGVDKGYKQLERLARTETVSAYWKNTFDSTADLDDIILIWSAEKGPKTCQWCLDQDGKIVEDESIRDHPNGRCTLAPTHRSRVAKGTATVDDSG
jgi:hypothetical protein